ncbi:MAG: putative lactoylglutathione lyase [Candidatus Azotimanducaceae bacterium]|jgi:predicted lactoylglutathione lyase
MIGYITLGTNDLEKSGAFYDELLAVVGAKRVMTDERMLGWRAKSGSTMLSVIKPFDKEEASIGNGVMIALDLENSENVERFYEKALSLGAVDEGKPHDRGSSMGFYGGYFRDLDGNKIVAYCLGWNAI